MNPQHSVPLDFAASSMDRSLPRHGGVQHASAAVLLLIGILWGLAGAATAAPPDLKGLFPAGGWPGGEVTVKAEGTFESWPVQWWVDRPGLSIVCRETKGDVVITVAPDAGQGRYWVRAFDVTGASTIVPFLVSAGVSVTEQEPNDRPKEAQSLEASICVDAKLGKNEDVDCFALDLDVGDALRARVDAHHWLGSPVDAVLQVCDDRGRVLKHQDDGVGLDPAIEFVASKEGRYLVRVFGFPSAPNSTIGFVGGESMVYRLTVQRNGEPGQPSPAILGSNPSPVMWENRHLATPAELWQSFEEDRIYAWGPQQPQWAVVPRLAGVQVSHTAKAVPEPLLAGQAITLPGPATKEKLRVPVRFESGQNTKVRILAQAIAQPLDPVLRMLNAAGEVVANVDDIGTSRDAEYLWDGKAAADLVLEVQDRFDRDLSDTRFVIALEPAEASITVSWKQDRWSGKQGEPIPLKLTLQADRDLEGQWQLELSNSPPHVTCEAVALAAIKKEAQEQTLQLQAESATSGPLQVVLKDSVTGKVVCRAAIAVEPYGFRYQQAWLTILASE